MEAQRRQSRPYFVGEGELTVFFSFSNQTKAGGCSSNNDEHAEKGTQTWCDAEKGAVNKGGKNHTGKRENGTEECVAFAPAQRPGKLCACEKDQHQSQRRLLQLGDGKLSAEQLQDSQYDGTVQMLSLIHISEPTRPY